MYERFYGFKERPFTLLPDPGFLFLSRRHAMALAMLEYGLANASGITVMTGEIGSGKTTLLRHLLNRLGADTSVGLISNTHHAFGELLEWVLLAYGLEFRGKSKAEMYRDMVDFMVGQYARGRRTLLIVDEAQNMDPPTLEELRVLSNVNADKDQVIQLVLVGQPELRGTLRRPELAQFAQRVATDYHLEPLEAGETDAYIRHRLGVAGGEPELFEPDARAFVHRQSGGVPRLINSLCDMALVYGYAAQSPRIGLELLEEVVEDRRRRDRVGLHPPVAAGGETKQTVRRRRTGAGRARVAKTTKASAEPRAQVPAGSGTPEGEGAAR